MKRLGQWMVAVAVVGLSTGGATAQEQASSSRRFVARPRSRSPSRPRGSSGNEVVTTFVVRNPATTGAIAGLKVEENWYDKGGNPVTGDTYRHPRPLKSGEIISITLRTPRNPAMNSNQYQFSHANGTIKTDDRAEARGAEDA